MSRRAHAGGCHCAAVRFEVEVDLTAGASRCNCTWCIKRGTLGVIVKPSAFTLRVGGESLSDYAWGARVGRYFFCARCGVHVFGRGNLPELGGDYVAVNVNCLDEIDPSALRVVYWDGRHDNWDAGPRETPWPVAAANRGADARI